MIRNEQKKSIGALLYEYGMITKEQLEHAIEVQEGRNIEEVLVEQGMVREEEILEVLEFILGIPYVNLNQYTIVDEIASLIPEHIARRYTVVAIDLEGEKLKVAMKDPLNWMALEDLKRITNREIIPLLALKQSILRWINQIYASVHTSSMVEQVTSEKHQLRLQHKEEQRQADGPMTQLVDNILHRCILMRASDLHIEPFEQDVRIRYRIDGVLYEFMRMPRDTLEEITACIKILAKLDITNRRLPQDGRFSKSVEEQKTDLRVSVLPTIYGEKTVIRLIYRQGKNLALEEIGFTTSDYKKVRLMLKNPYGIILLTGPTGSGKSTTLAAALRVLNKEHVNIVTVEDPVENMITGINQVATNDKVGLTFGVVLRAILRQDPDVIMIGEMRDYETSTIAIRAAITGHLVLSTLHTNDAASSIPRLKDMGVEAYMVGAAVKGVISQRLVRRLCPSCKKKHRVTEAEARFYELSQGTFVYKAQGCSACHYTGYKGRMAIHEVLVVDHELQELISCGKVNAEEIKAHAIKKGMRTLWQNGLEQVLKGNTTMEEILRVAYDPLEGERQIL